MNRVTRYSKLSSSIRNTHAKSIIGVVQCNSGADRKANFEQNKFLVGECVSRGASLVCLPEYFAQVNPPQLPKHLQFHESLNGPTIMAYRKLAHECNCWLSLGGFQETSSRSNVGQMYNHDPYLPYSPTPFATKSYDLMRKETREDRLKNHAETDVESYVSGDREDNSGSQKRYNTHLIINNEGQIVSVYRKIHLFDIDLRDKGGFQMEENLLVERGTKISDPVYSPCGYLGLSISFDVRFPEMFRELVMKGAQTFLVPSKFIA